jgi:vacuolar-type H+-ATPase subunit I/STV1
MLGAVPMVHMQIQVPSREAPAVTRHIAAQGLLHLIDIAHGRIAADAAPPGTRDELAGFRDLVRRIRRVAERLEIALPDPAGALPATEIRDFAVARRSLESQIGPIESAVDEAWRRQSDAREQSARAHDRLQHAERLRRGEVDVARLSGLRFTTLTLGLIRVEEMSSLAAVLAPAPFAIVPLDVSEGVALAAVAVPASVSDRLESSLRVVTFEPVSIADGSVEPDAAQRRVTASEEAVRQAADDLGALRSRWTSTLVDLARRAELGALLLQAQTFFAASGRYASSRDGSRKIARTACRARSRP